MYRSSQEEGGLEIPRGEFEAANILTQAVKLGGSGSASGRIVQRGLAVILAKILSGSASQCQLSKGGS